MPWGYNPENFVQKFDWLRDVGKDVAQIPIAIQAQQELNAGKIRNGDIYKSLTAIAEGVEEDEFERSYGMKKQTFLQYAKPGKTETPEMYMARAFKLTEKGNAALSSKRGYDAFTQELTKRQQGITGVPEQQKAGAAAEGMTPETMQAIGNVPRQPGAAPVQPVKPTEVQSIGAKYGVAPEQIAPQVKAAEQAQTTQQMGNLNQDMTRTQGYKAVGGEVTPTTEKAIATLPTEKDLMTDKRLRDAADQRYQAQLERNRLASLRVSLQSRKLTSDERRDILDSKVKNEVAKKRLEIQIKALESGLTKSNKNIMGELDQASVDTNLKELEELKLGLSDLEENSTLYMDLLSEKGGIQPSKKSTTTTTAKNNDPLGIR